ncbi:MAG: hypothetical protein ACREPH_07805 [Rhodanobacteraceae bacterium]
MNRRNLMKAAGFDAMALAVAPRLRATQPAAVLAAAGRVVASLQVEH